MYRIAGTVVSALVTLVLLILFIFPATLFDSPVFGLWDNVFGDDDDTVACFYPATGGTVDLDEDVCEATGGQIGGVQATPVPTNPPPVTLTPIPVNTTPIDQSTQIPQYACPDGKIVTDPNQCASPTPIPVQPTPVAVNPTAIPTGSNNVCQPGDKVGTFPEGNNPHRIEVRGHGIQHLDFYPTVGVKSISFLVEPGIADPEGVPHLAWGYGSIWEWNPPGCDYDLLADETAYAQARLDSGHSGLVVQWGTWEIKANVSGMSQADAEALVNQHRSAFGKSDEDRPDTTTAAVNGQQVDPAPAADTSCSDATRIGDADNQTVTVPAGHTYVVAAWAPREELMVFAEGQTIEGVKGALWDYACGIDSAIAAEQAQGKNPVRQ